MLTVFRTEIKIGNQVTFAYSANEADVNGNLINYLNGTQLAEIIGEPQNSTILKRLSKEMKALLGDDFTTIQGRVKTSQGNFIKVSLWDTDDCITYWTYHAEKGNRVAFKLICALAATSLDTIINDAFDRDYKKGQTAEQTSARLDGKVARRTLTDSIKDYLLAHPTAKQNLYAIVTDLIYLGIFNRRAVQLKDDWNEQNPRDGMTRQELFLVAEVEALTSRLIDFDSLHPLTAVKQSLMVLRIPVCDR